MDKHEFGGDVAAEEEIRDLVEMEDEDGNTVLLEVQRYFFYNGDEYVVLAEVHDVDADEGAEGEEERINCYLMKVVESEEDGEDMEEFQPIEDDDLYEKLIKVAEAEYAADESFDEE